MFCESIMLMGNLQNGILHFCVLLTLVMFDQYDVVWSMQKQVKA